MTVVYNLLGNLPVIEVAILPWVSVCSMHDQNITCCGERVRSSHRQREKHSNHNNTRSGAVRGLLVMVVVAVAMTRFHQLDCTCTCISYEYIIF